MSGDADLAAVGALVGDRVRAAILLRLLDGGAASASDLAAAAGASPSLTSAHLRRLVDGGLVLVEVSGRRRLHRLASVEVAEMLEVMQLVAPALPVTSLRGANSKRRLRRARLCYDHLAGVLGAAVTDALAARGALRIDAGPAIVGVGRDGGAAAADPAPGSVLVLGDRAAAVLAEVDVSLDGLLAASRPVLRQCVDWTERRPHVSGGLGAAVAGTMLDRAWVVRRHGSRGLDVTADGAAALDDWLGLRLRDVPAWTASA